MRALRLLGRVALVLLVALVLSNVLLPAVARAQFAAAGGASAADVLAALVGKDVAARSFVASAPSGSTGVGCVNNGCRVDYGAGASDHASSNGSVVTFASSLATAAGQSFITSTLGNAPPTLTLTLAATGGVVEFPYSGLPDAACGTSPTVEGTRRVVAASTGVASKVCTCLKDAAGAFAWRNLETGATGTTTSCP